MKKAFVLLLSGVITASSISMNSLAASDLGGTEPASISVDIPVSDPAVTKTALAIADKSATKEEGTNAGLEAAILAVKKKITIPQEYSEFNYYFYNGGSEKDSSWNLTWRNPKSNGYIQVNCDGDNNITYFSQYNYSENTTGVPKYLRKELIKAAEDFAKKLIPDAANSLELIDTDFDGIYSNNYVYHFQRKSNNIAFPDNRITVWMSSITGEASSLSANWLYGEPIPAANAKLTKEEATKLIKENLKMKLVYRSDYYSIYSDLRRPGNPDKAYLVYEPTVSYISVDAKTGKVYLTKTEWVDTGYQNGANETAAKADMAAGAQVTLTEEEQAKVAELKKLITKDKAIELVTGNPYLYIDKSLRAYAATLQQQNSGKGDTSYVWYINFSNPGGADDSKIMPVYNNGAYAYATVDAKSGKILSFYSSVNNNNYDEVNQKWKTVKINYDKNASKKILENFLKTQIPDRFNNSVLAGENNDYIAYYKNDNNPVYGGYSYTYYRTNEGVEYANNSIYGSVDGITGKIYSYGSYWDNNITFESTKGVMTPEEALDHYLTKEGYGLKYEINVINEYSSGNNTKEYYDIKAQNKVKYEIRLVYRPDVIPALISPFTGEQLNYDGSVFTKAEPYTYKDIKDIPENREILLLADMNIGFEGDYFKPDQAITEKELQELLQKIGYGYRETDVSEKAITKEKTVQLMIKYLGLEKLSKLKGIYKTGFADDAYIGSEYYGAVALAKGLGLVKADEMNMFHPKKEITRMEAVKLIINYLQTARNGLYDY